MGKTQSVTRTEEITKDQDIHNTEISKDEDIALPNHDGGTVTVPENDADSTIDMTDQRDDEVNIIDNQEKLIVPSSDSHKDTAARDTDVSIIM